MEIISLVLTTICFMAIALLISILIEVLHGIIKEMADEKVNIAETTARDRGKFRCTYRDYEHIEAPWGCIYEFPKDDDCDSCPFAEFGTDDEG